MIPRAKLLHLLNDAYETFAHEDQLLKVEFDRVAFVGDTHGDLESTRSVVSKELEKSAMIFLGDYVDRGPKQLENIIYLLELKLDHPDRIILLRGNHETPLANRFYGFESVVTRMYDSKTYGRFTEVFSVMPYAALTGNVLALHGGIARKLRSLDDIRNLRKGIVEPYRESSLALEILWNDPSEDVEWFGPSIRGEGIYVFGPRAYESFARDNNIDFMVRAHQVFTKGYNWYFNGKVLSIFSARHYGLKIDAKYAILEGGVLKVERV
ncbi:MAG TPA: serine/threonine protein phosphatase [Candidatus Bathyarchaeota archaeon]|nr:serine/threonine protein phosphatase [Candidatus Bathyarchaeota archaeon]